MREWLIEPRDPLIARDGRPSENGRFSTLGFPYPSMLAGAVRTRMASGRGSFDLAGAELDELKKIPVQGPLLVELVDTGEPVIPWLVPAPRDAFFERRQDGLPVRRVLRPRPLEGRGSIDSFSEKGLMPVFTGLQRSPGKAPKIPAFWRWDEFEEWLIQPEDRDPVDLQNLGIDPLPVERRVHIALQPGERVGIDGALFETAGLRFLQATEDSRLEPRRFALSVRVSEGRVGERSLELIEQVAALGGERRLAHWSPSPQRWPVIPEAVRQRIVATRRARIILSTPAFFSTGALPGWSGIRWPLGGPVQATVRAACVSRPEIVSGWDLAFDNGPGEKRGRPKPTRRLAAAGSVYFVELAGGTPEEVASWCDTAWLAPVSDTEQERRDGFGLAFLGTWEERS